MNQSHPLNVLFVCAQNQIRSYTAEKMFADSPLYRVRSRGVAVSARVRLSAKDIAWADAIFVMEKEHKTRIAERFAGELAEKKLVCLFIDDIYRPFESSLVEELRSKLAPYLTLPAPEAKKAKPTKT